MGKIVTFHCRCRVNLGSTDGLPGSEIRLGFIVLTTLGKAHSE